MFEEHDDNLFRMLEEPVPLTPACRHMRCGGYAFRDVATGGSKKGDPCGRDLRRDYR